MLIDKAVSFQEKNKKTRSQATSCHIGHSCLLSGLPLNVPHCDQLKPLSLSIAEDLWHGTDVNQDDVQLAQEVFNVAGLVSFLVFY